MDFSGISASHTAYFFQILVFPLVFSFLKHILFKISFFFNFINIADNITLAYIRAIKDMYDGAKNQVGTVGGESKHFPVEIGLHYGSLLRAFLFTLVMDERTRFVQEKVL